MKGLLLSLMAVCYFSVATYAQDDDVYFVPSRNADKQQREEANTSHPTYSDNTGHAASNWAEGRGNGQWDVDQYNRRGSYRDSIAADSSALASVPDTASAYVYEDADATYTVRLIRFHSPRVGIYVSSPYYDSFFYDPFWADFWPYNYWTWNSWYGWGYAAWGPWSFGWYDPWYGPYWGWNHWWGWHYGPAWGGWYPHYPYPGTHWAGNARRGPTGGYVAYSRGGAGRGRISSSRYGAGSRNAGRENAVNRNIRPSRNYGNTSSGNRRSSERNTPSRSYNRNSQRSYSTPSSGSSRNRSGSFSTGSRSGGGFSSGHSGGGRSFGGGGGSRGGRR